MKFLTVYDKPGRLRVRFGPGTFNKKQGCQIADLLLQCKGVAAVDTCAVNGSVLISYTGIHREQCLKLLNELQFDAPPESVSLNDYSGRHIDRRFTLQILSLTLRHFLKKLLPFLLPLPLPFRYVITLLQAMSYWRAALRSLATGRLDVAVLDAASIGGAILQRQWNTASSIMYLLRLSGLLEDYTRKKTQTALAQSLTIHIDTVWLVLKDGIETSIPMKQLKEGDQIRVRAGSLIPIDGMVTHGDAMVNESSMTGESLPVHRHAGSAVYAGTVLEEGTLTIQVTALADKSRIQQIVSLIESSEALKADTQCHAEHLADAIVPFSFLGSIAVGLLTRNLTKALSVLMVDYSCAIKLSTPIAIISAMREAADHRIMVKGGKFLEAVAGADTVVFDKTGTLTAACPWVEKILDFTGMGEDELLRIAACIEEHFPHSMARAVTRAAQEKGLNHEENHAEVEYVVAHGLATTLSGTRALIGSHHFIFEDEGTTCTDEQLRQIEAAADGMSVLYLAFDNRLAGVLFISDPPRPEAKRAIASLRKLGIRRIMMLTGDQDTAARSVCLTLGIDEFKAQVLPADKAALVESYKSNGSRLIMVGDGINDSPALAAADVSIAMKDASDLAREVADITLLSSDLQDLAALRLLSRGMLRRIHRNYWMILTFNSLLLLTGIAGVLPPTTTALLHNVSTMAISASSMRSFLETKDLEQDLKK